MTGYFIGIDSGTQSTKAIFLDAESGEVLATASAPYELIEGLPAGHKEQHPATWIAAVRETVGALLAKVKIDRRTVRGIGISGQQHGFVPLDERDEVIRPAKLWCDTSTIAECEELIAGLGGLASTIEEVGNGIPAGFTASKILWLKKHEPENFARLRTVLLPHDYLNFWLTGRKTMECGDASGTALLDVRRRVWSERAVAEIDAPILALLLVAWVKPTLSIAKTVALVALAEYAIILLFGGLAFMFGLIRVMEVVDGPRGAFSVLSYVVFAFLGFVFAALGAFTCWRYYSSDDPFTGVAP